MSLFNHFYDTVCTLPLVVFLTFDNEREQYLVCAALKAGNAPAKQGVENRIKALKAGVEMDRASCTSFCANRFRVLLSAAASALLQELRWRARETRFARTQAEGLRLCLLKLGAGVRSSTRRVVLSLPREAPYVSEWLQIARSLGAVPKWGKAIGWSGLRNPASGRLTAPNVGHQGQFAVEMPVETEKQAQKPSEHGRASRSHLNQQWVHPK